MNESRIEPKSEPSLEQTRTARELVPPVDIYENEQELLVVADVPGVSPEGLELRIEPPELRIKGTTVFDESTVYYRAFRIDERIASERVSAELKDGVLKVHLPKAEKARPRKVDVRVS
jgi:HSP20 family molecular chaperone IbpA